MPARISLLIWGICLLSGLAFVPISACSQSAGRRDAGSESPSMAKEWGLLFFGGQMSGNDFGQTLAPSIDSYRKGIYFAGAAVSRRLYRAYSIDIELEGGAGYQYAVRNENDSGQI